MSVRPKKLTWRKSVVLVLFGVLVGAGLFEGAYRLSVRWIGPRWEGGFGEPVVPFGTTEFDELLGWRLKPLASGSSYYTGRRVEYRINSKGIRGEEMEYKKPPGVFRVVLLGDSHTFGWGIPIEDSYSTLLEGYFKKLEVVNMGVFAYGVDQEYLLLKSEGLRYEPDLVVVYVPNFISQRHMHGSRWGAAKPLFKIEGEKLVLTNTPLRKLEPSGAAARLNRYLEKHLRAYRTFVPRIRQLLRKKRPRPVKSQHELDEENMKNEDFKEMVHALAERLIKEMRRESEERGAKFLVVTKVRQLEKACREAGIMVLDVEDPLSNPSLLLRIGGHMNEAGNGVLAWELAKFLKEKSLVPRSHLKD